MTRRGTETRTIQTWPGGTGYTFRGDPYGPKNQRSLKITRYNGETPQPWRKGTAAEWRTIRIALTAERIAASDILCCDSSLVDDLLKEGREGFSWDDIEGVYADPSDWDADKCREYASDYGIELPTLACACDDVHTVADTSCPEYAEQTEDDGPRGWLTEAREACRDHAQDNPAEVYEWYRVTSWLRARLAELGEVTLDNGYGDWWGRTCTGQQLIMDGTLQQVAAGIVGEGD